VYDAIVVGARCAGSPTAMLLARQGHRVLVVDRARFPSDMLSTHLIHPPGVAALRRWGLLEKLEESGCPPIRTYSYNFGPMTISGSPRPIDGIAHAYGPRRTVLDKILVDAAAEAGAEVREEFAVDELIWEDGRVKGVRGHALRGEHVTEQARVVIGADGRHSLVAKAAGAEHYDEKPIAATAYYAYWRDLPAHGLEFFIRPHRAIAMLPTNDGLTMLLTAWPQSEFHENRGDIEGNYLSTIALVPQLAERLAGTRREERFRGGGVENFFRAPYGPGWALVGDAGYTKDPCTAWGISDAFHDAERCADGLHEWLDGSREFEDAMSAYQRERDQHAKPMYELTSGLAPLDPPPPEMQQLLGAAHGNREAMDDFVSVMAGTLPVAEFFGPPNAQRLLATAAEQATPGSEAAQRR
jgi:2-polyprenyl-6-methoxyphenol hydroxylase-like FAD-dependent oxidoreductase